MTDRMVTPIPKPGPKRKRAGASKLPDPLGLRECVGPARGLPGRCEGALQRHHVVRRSQGGPNTPENLLWLCRGHHQGQNGVHSLVALAKSLGLLG